MRIYIKIFGFLYQNFTFGLRNRTTRESARQTVNVSQGRILPPTSVRDFRSCREAIPHKNNFWVMHIQEGTYMIPHVISNLFL